MSTEVPSAPFADLDGRVAIVTGATRGLGREIAVALGDAGARVLLVGRDRDQGRLVSEAIPGSAFHPEALEADGAAERVVGTCVEAFGGVDILVNNAAIYPSMPVGTMTAAGVARMFAVNASAPILLMQEAAAAMISGRRAGSIVNVISTAAFRPVPNQAVYGASKAALALATRAFAAELAADGVRVNAISPGAMDHGDGGRAAALGLDEQAYDELVRALISRIPLGRKAASREVAACALFLCSSLASVVTGHVLHCDGGETI